MYHQTAIEAVPRDLKLPTRLNIHSVAHLPRDLIVSSALGNCWHTRPTVRFLWHGSQQADAVSPVKSLRRCKSGPIWRGGPNVAAALGSHKRTSQKVCCDDSSQKVRLLLTLSTNPKDHSFLTFGSSALKPSAGSLSTNAARTHCHQNPWRRTCLGSRKLLESS